MPNNIWAHNNVTLFAPCNKAQYNLFTQRWQQDIHSVLVLPSILYTTSRVLYSPLYQAAMQAYLLCTIEEKSWAQMNKNTLFLVWKWWFLKASNVTIFEPNCLVFVPEWRFWLYLSIEVIIHSWRKKIIKNHFFGKTN